MTQPGKRPSGLTVIAWLWIVSGALMGLGALLGTFAYSIVLDAELDPALTANAPAGLQLASPALGGFDLLLGAQVVVAVLSLWAGVALLRLRSWARTAIEALSWLGLLYCVGFGIFWIYLWGSITGQMPPDQMPVDPGTMRTIGAIIGVVLAAVFAIPLYLMIRYLRGPEARAATRSTRPA